MKAIPSAPSARLGNANPALFLRRAKAQLSIALQPIVDIGTGKIIAYESLARGSDQIGFMSIEDMFNHAFDIGMLLELETCLIEKAIKAFAPLRRRHWCLLFLNLDGRTLTMRARAQAEIERCVRAQLLDTSDICVELSERNQVLDAEQFACEVEAMRLAGLAVAIDDFGTGNSGLQMLYQSQPNFVKIDRFFISSIQSDRKKRLMVSSIVDLSHTMGVRVIAEGIETLAELHACRGIRCDLVQGYLIEAPKTDIAVLKTSYPIVAGNCERRLRNSTSRSVEMLVEPVKALDHRATLMQVFELFQSCPEQTVIPILDGGGLPKGVVRETDIKPFIYSRYGRDLLINRGLGLGLKDFIKPIPTADVGSQLTPLLDLVAERAGDGIVVTEGMRYVGMLPPAALARLANEARLEQAADRYPLTRLPANGAIKAFIDQMVVETELMRVACYADLDNFKPFNDKYGFRAGDRALLFFADHLKSLEAEREIFIGHVGGDDFFIGAIGVSAERLCARLAAVLDNFRREVAMLYEPHDRDAGYVTARDRDGHEQRFPLLSCTIAALEIAPSCRLTDAEAVSMILADEKRRAKERKGALTVRQFDPGCPRASEAPAHRPGGAAGPQAQGSRGRGARAV